MSPIEERAEAIRSSLNDYQAATKADVVVFSGPVLHNIDYKLYSLIQGRKRSENVTLFISTFGGNPNAAYKIARHLQLSFKKFTAVVHAYCKSAGTLTVMGAHELVMSNRGELGPLDIQVGRLEEKERTSGLAPVQALKILQSQGTEAFIEMFRKLNKELPIQTKTVATVAERIVSELYSKVYSQLEPIRLGEYQRAMSIMTEYSARLAEGSKNVKEDAITQLVQGYPDHGFAIDRHEACDLFHKVRSPNHLEQRVLNALDPLFADTVDVKDEYFLEYSPANTDETKASSEEQTNVGTRREEAGEAGGADPAGKVRRGAKKGDQGPPAETPNGQAAKKARVGN